MIEKILQRQNYNGGQFWSRTDGDIHAPFGFSTIDTLYVLGELGYLPKDNSKIADAIDFIFSYQTTEGCFKYSPKSSKLPCLTARIIAGLGRLGLKNDKLIPENPHKAWIEFDFAKKGQISEIGTQRLKEINENIKNASR